MGKRHYYLITDCKNGKDYLIWRYTLYDILSSVTWFAKKQSISVEDLRCYPFETKKQWEDYGNKNFYRIAYWQDTRG